MNMLTKVLSGTAIAFVLAVIATNVFASPLSQQVFDPSVRLEMADGGKCSGTIISSERDPVSGDVATIVLTAKHCTEGQSKMNVVKESYDETLRMKKADVYPAKVLGQSYKSDLALLRLDDKDDLFMAVAEVAPEGTKPEFAEEVYMAGYPLGRSLTYTKGNLGYVESGVFTDVSQSSEFYRATPDIAPGSSGGAMYRLDGGTYEIIGIVTGGSRSFSFMNFYTPLSEINDYLSVASKTYKW